MEERIERSIVGVRLVGLLVLSLALWQLLGNILSTWRDFDPSYLGYYVSSQLMRPLVGVFVGLGIMFAARPISKRIIYRRRRGER